VTERAVAKVPSPSERAAATIIRAGSMKTVDDVVAALPVPDTLPPSSLVMLPVSARSFASSLLAMLGRNAGPSRAMRCTALVARGYVAVGAARTDDGEDLAWGYVSATEPCSDS
jgi:hypothetical protein